MNTKAGTGPFWVLRFFRHWDEHTAIARSGVQQNDWPVSSDEVLQANGLSTLVTLFTIKLQAWKARKMKLQGKIEVFRYTIVGLADNNPAPSIYTHTHMYIHIYTYDSDRFRPFVEKMGAFQNNQSLTRWFMQKTIFSPHNIKAPVRCKMARVWWTLPLTLMPWDLRLGNHRTLFYFELAKSAILIVFVSYKIPIANLFHWGDDGTIWSWRSWSHWSCSCGSLGGVGGAADSFWIWMCSLGPPNP